MIAGTGTSERQWLDWGVERRFPQAGLPAHERVVIVAPHPDDEVLGCGGFAAMRAAAGVPVVIVAVTGGGASHPGSPTLSPADLIRIRAAEREAALTALLGSVPPTIGISIDDGAVAQHAQRLSAALADLLRPDDLCLTTWRHDGHPDHEATGRAAALACGRTGAGLAEFPIWTWHWAVPDDALVPWDRLRAIALSPSVLQAKRRAVAAFTSQIAPLSDHPADAAILPAHVLDRLLRRVETVFLP